ncbi:hypothetical protein BDK51DRAFT_38307 [Blyttiomyces helicus]|uniref:Uncharacterized protein n=1 Tax=Blyttiomyces helicus TaxID=388810 RepID=A0A4P9WQ64_9FUNG|nr:hypothetical protein BDK51DRAFT_38307 [Blyttiomyces helicus]|eukprot:RKO92996.1 hypothetical protein BDK51DRAFT_38307 [Blyttiomyces helicus]
MKPHPKQTPSNTSKVAPGHPRPNVWKAAGPQKPPAQRVCRLRAPEARLANSLPHLVLAFRRGGVKLVWEMAKRSRTTQAVVADAQSSLVESQKAEERARGARVGGPSETISSRGTLGRARGGSRGAPGSLGGRAARQVEEEFGGGGPKKSEHDPSTSYAWPSGSGGAPSVCPVLKECQEGGSLCGGAAIQPLVSMLIGACYSRGGESLLAEREEWSGSRRGKEQEKTRRSVSPRLLFGDKPQRHFIKCCSAAAAPTPVSNAANPAIAG